MNKKLKGFGIPLLILLFPVIAGLGYITIYDNSTFDVDDFDDASPTGFDSTNQYWDRFIADGPEDCEWVGLDFLCWYTLPGSSENAHSSTDTASLEFYSSEWKVSSTGTWSFEFDFSAQGTFRFDIQSPSYFKFNIWIQKKSGSSWTTVGSTGYDTLIDYNGAQTYDNSGTKYINSLSYSSSSVYRFKVYTEIKITGDNGWFSPEEQTDFFNEWIFVENCCDLESMNYLHFGITEIRADKFGGF